MTEKQFIDEYRGCKLFKVFSPHLTDHNGRLINHAFNVKLPDNRVYVRRDLADIIAIINNYHDEMIFV